MSDSCTMIIDGVEVEALEFARPGDKKACLLWVAGEPGYSEFCDRYGWDYKPLTGVNLDEWERQFFIIGVADTYDPPLAVVRAGYAQDALDSFVEALTWAHVEAPDIADYGEDGLSIGPNGEVYDQSNIVMYHVVPVFAHVAGERIPLRPMKDRRPHYGDIGDEVFRHLREVTGDRFDFNDPTDALVGADWIEDNLDKPALAAWLRRYAERA